MRASNRLALPYLGGLTFLIAVPAVAALVLAFSEYSGIQPPRFNGIDNFTRLLGDPFFWNAVRNSFIFVLIFVPLRLLGAAGAALLLHKRSVGSAIGRPIAYLPTVFPDIAYALLWLWLLNPLYGPLTAAVEAVGLTSPNWLTEPWVTRIAIAVMMAFQIGEGFVVALAARRALPPSIYEAAAVDGAKPFFTLTRITLPLMAPILALLAFRDLILSFQLNFVPALIVTGGGPRLATTFLPLYIYRSAFTYFRFGYASAMSVTLFLFTLVVVYIQYRLIRKWRRA
jgi:multiple sugar transport system permease protein